MMENARGSHCRRRLRFPPRVILITLLFFMDRVVVSRLRQDGDGVILPNFLSSSFFVFMDQVVVGRLRQVGDPVILPTFLSSHRLLYFFTDRIVVLEGFFLRKHVVRCQHCRRRCKILKISPRSVQESSS